MARKTRNAGQQPRNASLLASRGLEPKDTLGVVDRKKMEKAPQLFRIGKGPTEDVVGVNLAKAMYPANPTNSFWAQLPFSDEEK